MTVIIATTVIDDMEITAIDRTSSVFRYRTKNHLAKKSTKKGSSEFDPFLDFKRRLA
jgi:hypothetical protein